MTGVFIVYGAVWSLSAWLQAQGEQGHDLHVYLTTPSSVGSFGPGLSYHWQSRHFPSHTNGSFCPEATAHLLFICSCITALCPWRTLATSTHTNQPHMHSRFSARSTFSRSAYVRPSPANLFLITNVLQQTMFFVLAEENESHVSRPMLGETSS